jgi:DNA-binding transcriptional LysR family regulator
VQNATVDFDWNDLKSFLAVARTGSTLAAGRHLHVSQTTAARRVAALEHALGVTLFERRQAGYALTSEGEALRARAEAVEASANAFGEAAGARFRDARGVVRLTTAEIYAVSVLAPILRDLHEAYPLIVLELDTADELRDLDAGAADIALRATHEVSGAGLVGRRITADPWSIYCSRDYADAHGLPRSRHALKAHALIGGGGENVWPIYRKWLIANDLERNVGIQHSSPTSLLSAVRAGAGLAVLPRMVAGADPTLIRCLPPAPGHTVSLWLLTHERVRHAPRIRVVIDFLYRRLIGIARRLDAEEAVVDGSAVEAGRVGQPERN